MKLLTSEPENLSICVWFRRTGLFGMAPVPSMVMVRIDQDSHGKNRWYPADAQHSDPTLLVKSLSWDKACELGKKFDGPYLLVPIEGEVND